MKSNNSPLFHSYLINPILAADPDHSWEKTAVFNGCVLKEDHHYILVYRALSDRQSSIGIAYGDNPTHFTHRRQFIKPSEDYDRFGCEDPRLTKFEGRYYTFYTAISSDPPDPNHIRVAVSISDDLNTSTSEKHLVTPFNAKAFALFPHRISGKVTALLTIDTDNPPSRIAIAQADQIEDFWSPDFWRNFYLRLDQHCLPISRISSDQVEIGAIPVETKTGWLVIYSHIQHYYNPDQRIFGIEAFLLNKDDPLQIIGRSRKPLLVPQEPYELSGLVPNVIFPSGAIVENQKLFVYYGAADTSICLSSANLNDLIDELLKKNSTLVPKLIRTSNQPLISPVPDHPWENKSTFNPAAIQIQGQTHLLYRAMSQDNTSTLGYASLTPDHQHILNRLAKPVYVPRYVFEQKSKPGVNSGCEDPRLTLLGDRVYLLYTAYSGYGYPRLALSSILLSDFIHHRWHWKTPIIISDPNIEDKDGCLFPEKINNTYVILHRPAGEGISLDFIPDLEFEYHQWLHHDTFVYPRSNSWDSGRIGISAPPVRTPHGWLLLYHGLSKIDKHYRVGALLLDLDNPLKILGRSQFPLLEPQLDFEIHGDVDNVVFPCGAIVEQNTLYVYYGAADKVVASATGDIEEITTDLVYNKN